MVKLHVDPDYTASNLVTGMARQLADLENERLTLLEKIRDLEIALEFQGDERRKLEQRLIDQKRQKSV